MHRVRILVLAAFLAATPRTASAKVRIVASTTDLASIARIVGGDDVDVRSIASGRVNLHYVEVLPSYMVRVRKADVYLKIGMGLDRWADQIIDGSRNGDLLVVDCSERIERLNVPTRRVDASMGDVHPWGNPHYWLDPANGLVIAEEIVDALARVAPEHADAWQAGLERFRARLENKRREWAPGLERLAGTAIVAFHDNWPYFSRFSGVEVAGFVEPRPGIEPTPSHTARIIDLVRARNIRVIVVEPYYSTRAPEAIARATGATIVRLPSSVGGAKGADDYFALFDTILRMLLDVGGR